MLFLIPYLADVVMHRWPVANWALIGLTIITSLAAGLWSPNPAGMLSRDNPTAPQLVSYLFLHAGFVHLAGNMLFLFVFGNAVNAKLGHWPYLLLYFASGLASGVLWVLLGPGDYCLGASGAIMGVAGFFAVYYPRNDVRMFWIFIIKWGTFALPAYWLILLYFLFDLWGLASGSGHVANAGHIGGLLCGLLAGGLLLHYNLVRSEAEEDNLFQLLRLRPYAEE